MDTQLPLIASLNFAIIYERGPMVHRKAHGPFKAGRGVQLPLGPPFYVQTPEDKFSILGRLISVFGQYVVYMFGHPDLIGMIRPFPTQSLDFPYQRQRHPLLPLHAPLPSLLRSFREAWLRPCIHHGLEADQDSPYAS